MNEVIVILSSSPLRSPEATKAAPVSLGRREPLYDYVDLDIDDFDDIGSLDIKFDRPSKRKRQSSFVGSPFRHNRADVTAEQRSQDPFEIFSSDGPQPEPRFNVSTASFLRSSGLNKKAEILDEITFSSSAPEPLTTDKKKNLDPSRRFPLDKLESRLLDDELLSLSQPMQTGYDPRTENLLATLHRASTEEGKVKSRPSKVKPLQNITTGKLAPKIFDDIEFSARPVKSINSSKLSEAERATRVGEKAAARVERQALKEAEKEKRRLEREQKAKEKQKAADLAEVNKSRRNKKDATTEMILDMSSFLKDTSVGNQIEERMKNVQVDVNYIHEEVNLADAAAEPERHGSIITWRRKVKSTYNDEDDLWEPTSRCRIVNENHVLLHLPAEDFVAIAAMSRSGSVAGVVREEEEMKANLDAHVSSIRRRFGDCVPIYLIEGLRSWLKKNETVKNRAYTAAVRAQMLHTDGESSANAEHATSQARSRKRKKPATGSLDLSVVTSDVVDDLLLHLQLAHQPILIHHTSTSNDSASQVCALTQHLSTRPYRLAQLEYNLKSASFCMDSGQVRTGDDCKDTYVKMLQEVQRVTPSMAYGIAEEYKTIRKLVKGFDKHGNLLLEDVRKTVNKDGGWSDKRLGPQISKRLYKVFMGRDPSSTDGMS
ncbi:uncharacterized protein Z519_01527 [Cladophialophora bantiana CBS 173.52]|uniref:ERCC4 domain-containing protein n=1 Tax=Cladophialophora bantiana (strain ATCC 10958 / CBS 173.52 / CDC B-1940 / NIH 8579) TaxID=1442370 RepID=A0A0D2HX32_CLAB1|nr:uncharacterized protein Z519_01527 [Cladophialophora bantiana CBS 173.52]KIW97943.1 hypothetical protein Z519_01527 [Cladophialophora bantiana CBS 173.52]